MRINNKIIGIFWLLLGMGQLSLIVGLWLWPVDRMDLPRTIIATAMYVSLLVCFCCQGIPYLLYFPKESHKDSQSQDWFPIEYKVILAISFFSFALLSIAYIATIFWRIRLAS